MTKIIFFDVDGTLRRLEDGAVADSTLRALHALRARGVKLFLATGRSIQQVRFLDAIFDFDGVVAENGQYCVVGGEIVRRVVMDPRDVRAMVEVSRTGLFPCLFENEHEVVLTYEDEAAESVFRMLDIVPDKIVEDGLDPTQVLKCIACVDVAHEPAVQAALQNSMITRWHPRFCDIGPAAGGKDIGIDAVLERLGIPLCESMAFGDGENDMSMLAHVGCGIAMGNASDKVKAVADYVTDSIDADGVAKALEYYNLI